MRSLFDFALHIVLFYFENHSEKICQKSRTFYDHDFHMQYLLIFLLRNITYYSPTEIRCYFFEKITSICPLWMEILNLSSIISLLTPKGKVLSSL